MCPVVVPEGVVGATSSSMTVSMFAREGTVREAIPRITFTSSPVFVPAVAESEENTAKPEIEAVAVNFLDDTTISLLSPDEVELDFFTE
mmetsp:Transcript_13975/g.24715  ORF Transcript_13975/g.24715 Transcript_13975/m.24715 type:complete len:89 (+) Transcript_13975:174-440(+)